MKLRAENIQKSYKGRKVVKGVSIEVNQGEIVGLLGPNGAGKTTSFYMIVGLVSPNEGKVFLEGEDITNMAMYKRAQRGIGYLPQEVSVFRKMSVEDNIMAVLEMTDISKEEREEKLESLLQEFGLVHVRKNLGHSLSGGEKRRTEIARALATDPKFILLDEPFAGVDPIAVEDIQKIVAKLKERNIGVLITDHNVQETLSITDRTYLLFEGSILRAGTAEELAADPQVRKVYLGKNFVLRKMNPATIKTAEERMMESKNSEETGVNAEDVARIEKVISQANETQQKIASKRVYLPTPEFVKETGVDTVVKEVDDLKEHLENYDFGNRGLEIFLQLKFGPIEKYRKAIFSEKVDIYFSLIPLLGAAVAWYHYQKRKKCRQDLKSLIASLEILKHLIANPEMEELF